MLLYDSFTDLVCIHPIEAAKSLIVMKVRAYIDESGTHGSSQMLSFGGVVSSFNKWKWFERGWQRALDKHHNGEPIHAQKLHKMNHNRELVEALFEQADNHVHFGLTVTADRQEFRDHYKIPGQPGSEILDGEYGLLFGCWAESARDLSKKVFEGQDFGGIWFVLEQSQHIGGAADVYRQIVKAQSPEETLPFEGFSAGKKEMPGIQLSDMMAHMAWLREQRHEPGFQDISGEISPETLKSEGKDGNPFPIFRIKLGADYFREQRTAKLRRKKLKIPKSTSLTSG